MSVIRRWNGTTWVDIATGVMAPHSHATNLDELNDVSVVSPVTGNVIRWSGTEWVNATIAQSDVSGLVSALAGKAATTHTHGVADLTATGTRNATTFLRGDNTWAVPAGGAGGDPIAPITPTEPAGAVDGLLWYDSDLELDDPEVYVQPDEPLGVPEGTLWYDSDEVAHQPIDGSTDIIDGTVTEAKLSTGVQTKLNVVPEKVAIQIEAGDKGAWSDQSAYVKGDVVSYRGKAWVATQNVSAYVVTGNDPTLTGKAISAASSATQSVTIPATVQVGDEMLVLVSNYSNSWTPTTLTGGSAGAWTVLAANQYASSTYGTYSTLLRKVAAAGDPGATLSATGLQSYSSLDFRAYRYATYDTYVFAAQNGVSTIPTPMLVTAAGRGRTVHLTASMTNTSGVQTLTVDTTLSDRHSANNPSNYFVAGSGDELRTSTAGYSPSRTFTSTAAGGFPTFAVSYVGTRTSDGNVFDTNVWQELPFPPSSGGRWELVQTLRPSGVSTTAASCRFDSIPTKYRKLRIECDGLNTSAATSGHIYMVFNSTTSLAYYCTMEYRTTGTYSVTNSSSTSFAYVGYSYFYTGPGRRNRFRVDVLNDTLTQPQFESDLWSQTSAGGYVYRSKCDGAWNSTARVTRIELYTSNGGNWNCEQPIYLYGWVD